MKNKATKLSLIIVLVVSMFATTIYLLFNKKHTNNIIITQDCKISLINTEAYASIFNNSDKFKR